MGAVRFQDTTNYHTVMPKAATPQFLLLEIVVLTSFSRAAGATHEARFSPIAAFCRLAKSLSHSELMGWLVGAVGIENNADWNFKDLEEVPRSAKTLSNNNRECKEMLIGPSMAPCFFESVKFVRHGFPLLPYVACRLRAQILRHGWQADTTCVSPWSGYFD